MAFGRKRMWALAASLVVGAGGITAASLGNDSGDTPVQAAGPVEEAVTELEVPRIAPTTTESTTTTTAPTTTTTAAPTTTTAPPPPPTTTTAPPPPPPPPPPPAPAPTSPPPAPSGPQHGARNTGCEQYMYDQINAARSRVGRGGLAFDGGIQYIAVSWSDGMAGRQVLAHNPNYGSQILRHRDYRTAGENVGRGYDLGTLFQAFMNSPGHRQNIESGNYSHVTVGCLTDGSGQLWVTQNFWG